MFCIYMYIYLYYINDIIITTTSITIVTAIIIYYNCYLLYSVYWTILL